MASAPPSGRPRLLLVDDDRAMLTHHSEVVTACGYDALTASNWSEALRLFREARPDLVLLDVLMPTIDGYKLARIIKAEAGAFLPVILVTALDDAESKRRGMAAGADDFLSKPVTPLELQIRVSAMLRIKELTDQLGDANATLAQMAVTDPLTGLHNRRSLYAELEKEFARAQRYKRPLALLMLDIDHFKAVNDTHGHQTGDRVLRMFGDVLRAVLRSTDLAGRFGGEEFMILAPETTPDAALAFGERVRAAVEEASRGSARDGLPPITTSVGIATTAGVDAVSHEALVQRADEALYRAKHAGRNMTVILE